MTRPIFVLTLSDIVGLTFTALLLIGGGVYLVIGGVKDWIAKRKRAKP